MKIYFLLLVISVLYEINCRCRANGGEREYPDPEDCLGRTVEDDEIPEGIDGISIGDFECCYIQEDEYGIWRSCRPLKSSEVSDYLLSDFYAVRCSLEQLGDERCFFYRPINKNSCFSRTLSDYEKIDGGGGFTPNKCCYMELQYEFHSEKYCTAVEESKLNVYIPQMERSFGLNPGDVNVICQETSTTPEPGSGGSTDNGANGNNPGSGGSTDNGANGNNQNNEPGSGGSTNNGDTAQKSNSSQFSRNNKLILIMFLMFLSI